MRRTSRLTGSLGLVAFVLPAVASAQIGDPCSDDDPCPPGFVCSTDEDGTMYCTGRCPAEGCPEGFFCRDSMGVRVCERGVPPMPVGFGEPCGEDACEEGLFCARDGDEQYCTRRCNGPATCPQGWSCTQGNNCKRRNGPPGFGDLCADAEPRCSEGLRCAGFPELGELCTQGCADSGVCGGGFECNGDVCAPPAMARSGIGGACNPGAEDAGCADGLYCYVSNADAYCTGPCNQVGQCPAGFGCVEVEPRRGECREGVADDAIFDEGNTVDPGGIMDPPPPAPPADMGPAEDTATDEGCECASFSADGAGWLGAWLLLLAVTRRRTRR